ncbi:ABC transporter substrate-binding protein [Streptomyces albipurpureus]|uniref:ABC transporter substrate-binding protein n=1 Tax=Streptomyces albipurpureus TaxID=2897419 RepID=A0ABT0V0T5_9ACTN|nr:ABC transporter substrate-binding protein [Streptomyces sp. CWNU-1]MCM2393173.1 ABC transporter substrate-binding protein [Streptomyces sp. CWNU-1]
MAVDAPFTSRRRVRSARTGTTRVRVGGVLLATALAVSLTACSGTEDSAGAPTNSGDGPSGTLRVGTNQQFDDWDTVNKQNSTFSSLVYESLMSVAPDGFTLRPQLATSWKESPDRIDITLRSGVVFHDGTPFDAEAVVKNLERIKNTPNQYRSQLDAVKTITAVDATHVRIGLKRAAPSLISNLSQLGMFIVSPKALADGTWKTKPAGTGPWTYDSARTTKGLRTAVRAFDKYYDKKSVGPARVEVTQIQDPDSLYNALRAGQLDVVWTTSTLAARAGKEGLKSTWFPSVLWHLQMYDTKGVFKDKKFRQAVCHAMNPQDYIDAALGGKGKTHLQRMPEGQPGHDPELTGYPFDLDKARKLLAEAEDAPRSFTLISYDTQRTIAELFRSQMEKIGIEVTLELPNFPQFLSTYQSGRYPAAILSDASRSGPYDYYNRKFAPTAPNNPLKVQYPELTAAAEEGLAAKTPEARETAWKKMSRIVNDEALDCGYFDYSGFWAFNPKKVDNIVSTANDVAVFRYKDAKIVS